MKPDIATLLMDTTPDQVPPLDLERAIRRGRRHRIAKRAGGGTAGLAVVAAVALIAVAPARGPSVGVTDPVASDGTSVSPSDRGVETPSSDMKAARAAWDHLTLQEAVDRLIALSAQAPDIELPPPDGQALRTHSLYLTQESGVDQENGIVDEGIDTWSLLEDVEMSDRGGVGWSQSARATTTRPAGTVDRAETRELAVELRPEQLGERFRIGEGTPVDVDWGGDYDEQAVTIVEQFDPGQWQGLVATEEPDTAKWRNFEFFGHTLMDTTARIDLLELLTRAHGVRYEGVVPDLAGRPAIAFSVPYRPSDTDGADAVRDWLLLSPDDASPVGTERFDSRGEHVEGGSRTLLDAELVPFDPSSVQELPAWKLSTPPEEASG